MNKVIHGGEVFNQKDIDSTEIIDFSANINPMGLTSGIREVMVGAIDEIVHYPQSDCALLKQSIANYHSLELNQILVGNGSIELMYLLTSELTGKRALCLRPSFSEYEYLLKLNGFELIYFDLLEENDFVLDLDALIKILDDVDTVFIGNPNNPTGKCIEHDDLLLLLKVCREKGVFLIVDEAFIDFTSNAENTIIDYVNDYDNLVVFRSMTKIYALAGLRLGYLAASKNIVNVVSKKLCPWNVNVIAQKAGVHALTDDNYLKESFDLISKEKDFLLSGLKEIPAIKVFDSDVNFFLCKLVNMNFNSSELKEELFKYKVLIRDCCSFSGLSDCFIRLAVRTREENTALLNALNEIYKKVLSNAC